MSLSSPSLSSSSVSQSDSECDGPNKSNKKRKTKKEQQLLSRDGAVVVSHARRSHTKEHDINQSRSATTKKRSKTKHSTSSCSSAEPVAIPPVLLSSYNATDVLFGRGGLSNAHVGNRIFRRLIDDKKEMYFALTKDRKTKKMLIMSVYLAAKSLGMRFLQSAKRSKTTTTTTSSSNGNGNDNDNQLDNNTMLWIDADQAKALTKIAQAFRERRFSATSEVAAAPAKLRRSLPPPRPSRRKKRKQQHPQTAAPADAAPLMGMEDPTQQEEAHAIEASIQLPPLPPSRMDIPAIKVRDLSSAHDVQRSRIVVENPPLQTMAAPTIAILTAPPASSFLHRNTTATSTTNTQHPPLFREALSLASTFSAISAVPDSHPWHGLRREQLHVAKQWQRECGWGDHQEHQQDHGSDGSGINSFRFPPSIDWLASRLPPPPEPTQEQLPVQQQRDPWDDAPYHHVPRVRETSASRSTMNEYAVPATAMQQRIALALPADPWKMLLERASLGAGSSWGESLSLVDNVDKGNTSIGTAASPTSGGSGPDRLSEQRSKEPCARPLEETTSILSLFERRSSPNATMTATNTTPLPLPRNELSVGSTISFVSPILLSDPPPLLMDFESSIRSWSGNSSNSDNNNNSKTTTKPKINGDEKKNGKRKQATASSFFGKPAPPSATHDDPPTGESAFFRRTSNNHRRRPSLLEAPTMDADAWFHLTAGWGSALPPSSLSFTAAGGATIPPLLPPPRRSNSHQQPPAALIAPTTVPRRAASAQPTTTTRTQTVATAAAAAATPPRPPLPAVPPHSCIVFPSIV